MRVLVIDEELPIPANTGKKIRTLNLLKHLAKLHTVHYIARLHEGEKNIVKDLNKYGIKSEIVEDQIRKKSGLRFYFALILNLFSRYPYSVQSHYSKKLKEVIIKKLKKQEYDIIHCEWTPYTINMPMDELKKYSSVVVAHNIESIIWKRNYELENSLLKKIYIYIQYKKMKRFEKKCFKCYDQTVVVSQKESEMLKELGWADRVTVVNNGVDVNYFKAQEKCVQGSRTLVFTGSMDWRPNVDGILYFIEQIWPLVRKKYKDAKLVVVGRNPMKILKEKIKNISSIHLTGTVKDVRKFVDESNIYIVPLRIGGGTRLKILEALSMQKAVISTTVGAEGLLTENNKHLLIADEPEQFAKAIELLFENSDLRKDLGYAGRTLVEEKYRWEILSYDLENSWRSAFSNKKK